MSLSTNTLNGDNGILSRFMNKCIPEPNSGCWLWSGASGKRGYGTFKIKTGVAIRAHRASYSLFNGKIADGDVICHKCDNPFCVNPQHLIAASQKYNLHDARKKGRFPTGENYTNFNKQKTQCKYGHPFNTENTHIKNNGQRECRICLSLRSAGYRARKRMSHVAE